MLEVHFKFHDILEKLWEIAIPRNQASPFAKFAVFVLFVLFTKRAS